MLRQQHPCCISSISAASTASGSIVVMLGYMVNLRSSGYMEPDIIRTFWCYISLILKYECEIWNQNSLHMLESQEMQLNRSVKMLEPQEMYLDKSVQKLKSEEMQQNPSVQMLETEWNVAKSNCSDAWITRHTDKPVFRPCKSPRTIQIQQA